ncbi:MAG: hypothetical protein JNK09_00750 [Prolixibacteraceae bacterium]|nr:hypothetical protein [Prolixibacteraceae bacterium]
MKKFAANYLISETSAFLKNGIVVLNDEGEVQEIVDTGGDLQEMAQLTFLNGILIPNFRLVKFLSESKQVNNDVSVQALISRLADGLTEISLHHWIEISVQVQKQFPNKTIPEIFGDMNVELQTSLGYSKQNISGLFLLKGIDLVTMYFTSGIRLKKIL